MKFKTIEEAAYMAANYKIRILIENPDWEGEREDAYIWSSNPLAIVNNWFDGVIHEDDYDIFEPQVGDFCEFYHKNIGWIFAIIWSDGTAKWKTADGELAPIPDDSTFTRIVKRESKLFHMPLENKEVNNN